MKVAHDFGATMQRLDSYLDNSATTDSWIGPLPRHWQIAPLKALTRFISRGNSPDYVEESNIFVLNQACIQRNGLRLENRKYQRDTDIRHWKGVLEPGDVVLNSTGTGTLGRLAVFADEAIWIADGHITIVRTRRSELDPWFLKYVLSSGLYQGFIYSALVTGATNQVELNREALRSLPIIWPPWIEQRAIVKFLDRETSRLDQLIAKKQRLIGLLEEKRAALIAHSVTEGSNASYRVAGLSFHLSDESPNRWESMRLKMLARFVTSGSRGWADYYSDEGALFLRIGNLSRTSIDLNLKQIQYVSPPPGSEGERTRIRAGDVLVSITAFIGSVAVAGSDLGEAYVNQHLALIRPRQDAVLPRWLAYCLFAPVGQEQFRALLYGGTKDGLGLDDVRNLKIPVPSLDQQRTISAYLDVETGKIETLVAKLRETIERLSERRATLITAAVTGQIDVRAR